MKITLELTTFRVRVVFDETSYIMGWDGDEPLDPKRDWTPYALFLEGQPDDRNTWHEIDCIGAVWASNDSEGDQYLRDSVETYFCGEHGVALTDIEIEKE